MLDIGWMELLLIGIVALIVVGPKELPVMFKTVGRYMGKARAMARDFQRSMEQAAQDSGLNEAAEGLKSVNKIRSASPMNAAKSYASSVVKGDDDSAADPGPTTSPTEPATPSPPPTADAQAAVSEPAPVSDEGAPKP